jgi:hypothetical protein
MQGQRETMTEQSLTGAVEVPGLSRPRKPSPRVGIMAGSVFKEATSQRCVGLMRVVFADVQRCLRQALKRAQVGD